jgi:glutaminase|tara:strand:- start:256 stop:444 length:189 start_codon:yes stop_codon:yes gene_type:complete
MYSDKFYSDQIKLNKNLLKSDKKKKRTRAIRNLLELKGRLKSELRTAQNQINKILNNPNYEE